MGVSNSTSPASSARLTSSAEPNTRPSPFAPGLFDGGAMAEGFKLVIDEGLEKLERHFLGQTALMELEFGADNDDGAAGVVNALAEEVLAETALLALERVGQGLERAIIRSAQN